MIAGINESKTLTNHICENGKYLASIMDDSIIMCDEIIKS